MLDENAARASAAREGPVQNMLDPLYLKTADASLVTAGVPEFFHRIDGRSDAHIGASGKTLSASAQCCQ
jgi:hypothetical protein